MGRFGLRGLVWYVWFGRFDLGRFDLGRFGLIGLVWKAWFDRLGLIGLV